MKGNFKKLFAVVAIMFALIATSNAQELGLRFGGMSGHGGVAIDGVLGAGSGRIHADLGFFNNGFAAEALWDLLYKPLSGEAFYWYLGVGPSLAIWDSGVDNSVFELGVSGEAGLEYRFNGVPIALGLDWRPTFWIIENTDFSFGGFGLNVRWVFGGN